MKWGGENQKEGSLHPLRTKLSPTERPSPHRACAWNIGEEEPVQPQHQWKSSFGSAQISVQGCETLPLALGNSSRSAAISFH